MPSSPRARTLLSDFPHPYRSADTSVFCAALGVGRTTIHRYIKAGLIDPPNRIGGRAVWPEVYIAKIATEGTAQPDPALS